MAVQVWVAGELFPEGSWRVLGLFTSAEKAAAVIPPRPSGFIFPYPLDFSLEQEPSPTP